MLDHTWSVASIRPYVNGVLSRFDVDRVMFASNFPVDKLFSSYSDLWHAFVTLTVDYSSTEIAKLFASNAERFYRLRPV